MRRGEEEKGSGPLLTYMSDHAGILVVLLVLALPHKLRIEGRGSRIYSPAY